MKALHLVALVCLSSCAETSKHLIDDNNKSTLEIAVKHFPDKDRTVISTYRVGVGGSRVLEGPSVEIEGFYKVEVRNYAHGVEESYEVFDHR